MNFNIVVILEVFCLEMKTYLVAISVSFCKYVLTHSCRNILRCKFCHGNMQSHLSMNICLYYIIDSERVRSIRQINPLSELSYDELILSLSTEVISYISPLVKVQGHMSGLKVRIARAALKQHSSK